VRAKKNDLILLKNDGPRCDEYKNIAITQKDSECVCAHARTPLGVE